MADFSRRQFGKMAGGGAIIAAGAGSLAHFAIAQGKGKVVVVGGGAGGATVAHHVKKSAPDLDVTLVEMSTTYTTCFFSNLYLGGMRTLESLTHGYDGLKALGVNVVHDMAVGVDATKKTVALKSGASLAYDRLVLSPGIDFKYEGIEGYSEEAAEVMPHAWKAGPQTKLLKDKLTAMEDGGLVVMAAPGNPYRCPPGPYERMCMIAHLLKTTKPKSKLIVLDPKPKFSKQPVFMEAVNKYYKDVVQLNLTNEIDNFAVVKVDVKTGEITTKSGEKFTAAVANIIPNQKRVRSLTTLVALKGTGVRSRRVHSCRRRYRTSTFWEMRRSRRKCPSRASRPTARRKPWPLISRQRLPASRRSPLASATRAGRLSPPMTA